MTCYTRIDTPLGPLLAVADGATLTSIHFEGARHAPVPAAGWTEDAGAAPLAECRRQVGEYFAGRRRSFDLPLAPLGTRFQRRVWIEIAHLGFGETLSYAALAERAGAPGAARAAGAATGRNPWALAVPCHRILGSRGDITGYAGGIERKIRLLAYERAHA